MKNGAGLAERAELLAELSTMLKAYKAAVNEWVTAIRAEEDLASVTPQWRSSTSGNKPISKKRKLGIKRKQQRKTMRTRSGKTCSIFDNRAAAWKGRFTPKRTLRIVASRDSRMETKS